jgi:hypothetical protein
MILLITYLGMALKLAALAFAFRGGFKRDERFRASFVGVIAISAIGWGIEIYTANFGPRPTGESMISAFGFAGLLWLAGVPAALNGLFRNNRVSFRLGMALLLSSTLVLTAMRTLPFLLESRLAGRFGALAIGWKVRAGVSALISISLYSVILALDVVRSDYALTATRGGARRAGRNCRSCGAAIDFDAVFCSRCGANA